MSKEEFIALVVYMVDDYGVRSYLDNITDDMTDEEIGDDIWFECPECGEPILYEDYGDSIDLMQGICPVCEMPFCGVEEGADDED